MPEMGCHGVARFVTVQTIAAERKAAKHGAVAAAAAAATAVKCVAKAWAVVQPLWRAQRKAVLNTTATAKNEQEGATERKGAVGDGDDDGNGSCQGGGSGHSGDSGTACYQVRVAESRYGLLRISGAALGSDQTVGKLTRVAQARLDKLRRKLRNHNLPSGSIFLLMQDEQVLGDNEEVTATIDTTHEVVAKIAPP